MAKAIEVVFRGHGCYGGSGGYDGRCECGCNGGHGGHGGHGGRSVPSGHPNIASYT